MSVLERDIWNGLHLNVTPFLRLIWVQLLSAITIRRNLLVFFYLSCFMPHAPHRFNQLFQSIFQSEGIPFESLAHRTKFSVAELAAMYYEDRLMTLETMVYLLERGYGFDEHSIQNLLAIVMSDAEKTRLKELL